MAFRFHPNLTSNGWLAFASLFIATVLWLIAKQEELVEKPFDVPIRFSAPPNAQIEINPRYASVTLRFPSWQEPRITDASCWVLVEAAALGDPRAWAGVEEFKPRAQPLPLDSSMVVLSNLPNTIQVVGVKPSNLQVQGKLVTLEAGVRPNLVGDLAAGFRMARPPQVEPSRVLLTGSPDALGALQGTEGAPVVVETAPIDLSGESHYVERETTLVLPEGIEPARDEDRKIIALIAIEELRETRQVAGAPIHIQTFSRNVTAQFSPRAAEVQIEGPVSMVAAMASEDFSITPKIVIEEKAGIEADVALDCQFHERVDRRVRESVRIVDFTPKSIRVRMVALETPTPPPTPTPLPTARLTPMAPTPTPAPRLTPMAIPEPTTPSLSLDLILPPHLATPAPEEELRPLRPDESSP